MADGNLGSLWMSLGLKESVTKDLKKLQQEFSGTDEKAKKAQETIKEINAALKKPTDTNAISGAFSKLATLLEKSKTDAKDLAVVLRSLNAKDVLSIFDGKITATNAKSYLDMINKIREAISGLGRAPGENTFNLYLDLNKAAQYLDTIIKVKDEIKRIDDIGGKRHSPLNFHEASEMQSAMKAARKDLLEFLNSGFWKSDDAKNIQSKLIGSFREIFRMYDEFYKKNLSTGDATTKVVQVATEALRKEEEQAKKTAEAVASIGEKKKYVAPNIQIQDKPVTTDVEKTANTTTKKLEEVKEKSDKAKSSVAALRTELNEVLNAFRGKASKTLGVGNAGERGRQYVDILNQINKKKAELYNKKGGEKDAAKIDSLVRTAQNYILLLKDIDREYEKISNMKSINPNVDDKNIKEALGLIEHFRQQLISLEGFQFRTGVDNANVLGNYKSFWGDTRKDANKLAKGLDNTNMLSDLQNKADRANARLAETNRQIERLDRAIDRGKAKGFNTDELFTNRAALLNRKVEFERALGKDTKRLSDINYMAGLYSETARDIKLASVAMEHFGNVQRKVAEQEKAVSDTRKARQSVNKEILDDYNRQVKEETAYQARQQKLADLQEKANEKRIKQANDITLAETRQKKIIADLDSRISNANSLYKSGSNVGARTTDIRAIIDELYRAKSVIQGYSGKSLLSFDYKNAVESLGELKTRFNEVAKAQSSMNREAEVNSKQRETNVRKMSELYTNLNKQITDAEKYEVRGLELNVDISKLDKAIAEARELAEIIKNANPKTLGMDGNYSLEDYVSYAKNIKTALDSAVKSQKELNTEREKENKNKNSELKALDAYAKRYMELVATRDKAMASMKEAPGLKNDGGLRSISNEIDSLLNRLTKVRENITLYNQAIENGTKESIAFGQQGLKEANAEAERLMAAIENLQKVYDTLRNSQAHVDDLVGNTFAKKRSQDILAKMSEFYKAEEKASAKKAAQDEAQSKREAAKTTREANAAEKQRQRELENTKNRIYSVENALRNLESRYSKPTMLNLDVRELAEKIQLLKSDLESLRFIANGLNTTNFSQYLGSYKNYGAGRTVSEALEVGRAYDNANKKAERGIDIERKRQQEIAKSAAKVQSDLVRGYEKANSHAGKLNSTIQDLKSLFLQGGLVFGAQQFAMSIITTGGEMEKQHIALQSILGDMQNANTLFGQIKDLALNSPFTFSELNRDVKQLAAYGVEYNNLYDTTKRLADMASGLGVSFDRIALAFGQVQARGWLDGKELRQIAYAGIPLLNKLSDLYSKREGQKISTSEIKTRISKREVSFDDVKTVFWEMTDAGGQFYNMQQTLSETLLGRYNKLKDAWEIMLAEFASGESIVGSFFKTALDGATTLVQALHTLVLPVTTIFAGYALKKALGANEGSSFLANKGKLASDIQARVLKGEQISQIERQILVTKNRITSADLKQLANAKVLTATELNRLRITGRITAEQYRSARALLLQQGAIHSNRVSLLRQLVAIKTSFRNLKNGLNFSSIWSTFATSGMAAIRLVGTGIKGLATTMWSAIGGLPGLVLSGITFGITYAISSYQELSNKIKQTQDELADKNKQIYEFLRDNNISITIAKGDDKEIDNMIDAYKEKIKELAPYDYRNIYMTAEEEKSHKERLKYLDEEIKRLKEANDIAASKLNNRGYYADLEDSIKEAANSLEQERIALAKATAPNATQDDKIWYDIAANNKTFGYKPKIDTLVEDIKQKFGDISKNPTLRKAAMQAMSALFSELKVPQDKADILRASVLQAFGIGEESDWLKEDVGTEMRNLINEVSPSIANKIKSGQKLNDAEKAKVVELMNSAKVHLKAKYPEVEETIQKMLAASRFEAVIRLVVDNGDTYTDVQNELSRRIPSVIGDKKLQEKYVKRAEEYGKDNDWYKARNAAKDRIDTAYNNYQSALKSGASNTAQLKEELRQEKDIARILLHYDYDGEGKKSNKPGKTGSQKDKALENLKDRIDLYKKLYDQIKKTEDLYGKGALTQLKQDEQFKAIFDDKTKYPISDYMDYKKSIEEMLHGFNANTEDRQTFVNNEHAGIQEKTRQDVADRRQDELKELEDQLQIIESQYEVYKKIYKLTGNKTGSQNVAFSGTVESDSLKKYLEKELDVAVAGDNENSGLKYTGSDVAAMSLKDVKDNYGEKTRTYTIRKRLEDENNKVKSETIDMLADIIEKNATIAQQIEDENRNYEYQKSLIENQENLDPEMKKRALEGVEKTHNDNKGKLEFEQFKQESDWVTIFDDLDRVSTNTINTMSDKIEDFSKKTGLSVEIVKQLREALNKLKDEQIERIPIPGIFGGVQQGNAIGDFIKSNFSEGDAPTKKVKVTDEQAQKMGLGKTGGEYTKAELENKQKSSYNTASKAISAFTNKVNAVTNVLQPVIDLFAALGNEDSILGTITGAASNAMGAASQTSQGLEALGLEKAGPYGAAVSAALSVATTMAGLHDKTLQKEIEASQQREKEMENLSNNLKSSLESTLGGVYNYERDKATKEKFSNYEKGYATYKKMSESNDEIIAWQGKQGLKKIYTEDGHDAITNANSKNNYYTDQLTLLKMQRIEKENQLNAESDKKKKDTGVIEDLKQEMAELDQQIKDYAQDFLKNIYSVDFKSWASELTDAVVEAWEKGGDAIDAYKKKAKDVVRDLTKTIVSQKIMEMALQKPLNFLTEELEKKGKLDKTTLPKLYDLLDEAGDTAVPMITQLYEWLKSNGLDLRDNGDTSSTNTIKGITEDQADILISYVNAIRLDVSVDRENVKSIANSVASIPELSIVAQSQLNSLNQLVMLAEYRNGKLDDMYSWMRSVTSDSGSKSLRIN